MILTVAGMAAAPPGWAEEAPAADAGERLSQRCDPCHRSRSYAAESRTRLAWHLILLRMQHFHGAELQPGEREPLVDHLATARPAPVWRAVLEWSFLAAVPAAAVLWWRFRWWRRSRNAPAFEGPAPANGSNTGEKNHG